MIRNRLRQTAADSGPAPPAELRADNLEQTVRDFHRLKNRDALASLAFAEAMVKAAGRGNSLLAWLHAKCLCAEANYNLSRFAQMQTVMDEIRQCEHRLTTPAESCLYYSMSGTDLVARGKGAEAAQHLLKAIRIGEGRAECRSYYWQALFCLGNLYQETGCLSQALQLMLQGLAEIEPNEQSSSPLELNLGLLYNQIGDRQKAAEFYTRRMDGCRRVQDIRGVAEVLLYKSWLLIDNGGDPAEARNLLLQASPLLEQTGNRRLLGFVRLTLTEVLWQLGRPEEAQTYLNTVLSEPELQSVPPLLVETLIQQAFHLRSIDGPEAARASLEQALAAAETFARTGCAIRIMSFLIEMCEEQEDWAAVLKYQKRCDAARRQMIGVEEQRKLVRLELLDARRRSMRDVETLRNDISVQRQQQAQYEREIRKLLLRVTQRDAALRKLHLQINSYRRGARKRDKKFAADLLASLMLSIGSEEASPLMESDLLRAFASTVQSLRRNSPALTAGELKICLLLRLDLSTKEIAAILFKSNETIRSMRSSIRRKLALSTECNLVSFLTGL